MEGLKIGLFSEVDVSASQRAGACFYVPPQNPNGDDLKREPLESVSPKLSSVVEVNEVCKCRLRRSPVANEG